MSRYGPIGIGLLWLVGLMGCQPKADVVAPSPLLLKANGGTTPTNAASPAAKSPAFRQACFTEIEVARQVVLASDRMLSALVMRQPNFIDGDFRYLQSAVTKLDETPAVDAASDTARKAFRQLLAEAIQPIQNWTNSRDESSRAALAANYRKQNDRIGDFWRDRIFYRQCG
jgi:hypothetical protein